MKVLKIDHVALMVKDLKQAEDNFINKLGAKLVLTSTREDKKYTVSILEWGESCLTLVHPDDPSCFVQKDLDRKGEGQHHMGIEVENLAEAEAHFIAAGGRVGPKETIPGVRSEFVVAPKNNVGLLLQVMEYFGDYKNMSPPKRYARLKAEGKYHF